ncbi:MAG TPA: VWA domain-containing protein, partial [Spirochaetota bacterium]|nr:VWA domain-containing protein [Spirochaetota bacterium]
AIGGTNIEDALKIAFSEKNDLDRLHHVIFITDGKPTIGETGEEKLIKEIEKINSNKLRIFTFGIGYDINTYLLDKITETTGAFRTYILPEEDIEIKISNFFMKVKSPVLTDIKLSFEGDVRVSKIYPNRLQDMFKGGSLNILGIYEGTGEVRIILEGKTGKKSEKFSNNFFFSDEKTKEFYIPKLWATRRVGFLLDLIRLDGEEKEIVDEIVYLAKKYGIVTPYTSFLIVEDEINGGRDGRIRDDFRIFNQKEDNKLRDESKKNYESMKKDKSGKNSVFASRQFQNLNNADNISEQKEEIYKEGLDIRSFQNKNIQNRTFYLNDKYWIDSAIYEKKNNNLKVKKIKFASNSYFELLNKKGDISRYLALGKNIRFLYQNEIYEIYE